MMNEMKTVKLGDLAKTVRSKNAGVDQITFDIIFKTKADYEFARDSNAMTKESICNLYGIPAERMANFVAFSPAFAIKFTIYRERPSGSAGDSDIFGAQQYAPLLDIEIPVE